MNIPFVEQKDNKEILLNLNELSSETKDYIFSDCWELAAICRIRSFMNRRYETSNNMDQICREFRKFNFILRKLLSLIPVSTVQYWNQFSINRKPFFSYVFHSILPFPDEFDENKISSILRESFYNEGELYDAIVKLITEKKKEKMII